MMSAGLDSIFAWVIFFRIEALNSGGEFLEVGTILPC